ncbi:DNA polymerase family B protein [Toxoplasma gondii TgCatPRC2]|uniref:DNA-directed DNA polymerase n=1 Tax=Toxoplasma gondii TgCatPRC2 TaxID=1130821 RepID=A0A151H644_TOXGO|nr:DNA polymerase family B protein [Toxoplasma gondii TgCatPRC2]
MDSLRREDECLSAAWRSATHRWSLGRGRGQAQGTEQRGKSADEKPCTGSPSNCEGWRQTTDTREERTDRSDYLGEGRLEEDGAVARVWSAHPSSVDHKKVACCSQRECGAYVGGESAYNPADISWGSTPQERARNALNPSTSESATYEREWEPGDCHQGRSDPGEHPSSASSARSHAGVRRGATASRQPSSRTRDASALETASGSASSDCSSSLQLPFSYRSSKSASSSSASSSGSLNASAPTPEAPSSLPQPASPSSSPQVSSICPQSPLSSSPFAQLQSLPGPHCPKSSMGNDRRSLENNRVLNPLVISVSVTVVEPCLEAPVPGLDPTTAPFSGRRLWRVPVLRIYGVVNDNPVRSVPSMCLYPPMLRAPPASSESPLSSSSASSLSSSSASSSSSSSSSSLSSSSASSLSSSSSSSLSSSSASSLSSSSASSSSSSLSSSVSYSSSSPSSASSACSSLSSPSCACPCPRGDRRFLGRMCCVTVHNVFPYFFVPLPREAHEKPEVWLQWFSAKLRVWEDKLTSRSDPGASRPARGGGQGRAKRTGPGQAPAPLSTPGPPLVFALRLVKKRAFYGYDHAPRLFVQISTLHPGSKTVQLAALLLQGRVTGHPLQPFEIHIPFVSHFLADFHLRGMDLLTAVAPCFVQPVFLAPPMLLASPGARVASAADRTHSPQSPSEVPASARGDRQSLRCALSPGVSGCPGFSSVRRPVAVGAHERGQGREGHTAESGSNDERRGNAFCSHHCSQSAWAGVHREGQTQRIQGREFMPASAEYVPGGVFLSKSWAQLWRCVGGSKTAREKPCGECEQHFRHTNASDETARASLGVFPSCPSLGRPEVPARGQALPVIAPALVPEEGLLSDGSRFTFRVLPARVQRRTKCELECHVLARNILNPFFVSKVDSPNSTVSLNCSLSAEETKGTSAAEAWERSSSFAADLLLPSVLDFWREEATRCAGLGISFPFDSPHAAPPAPPTLPSAAAAALAQRDEAPARGAVPEIFKRRLAQLLAKTGVLTDVSAVQAHLRRSGIDEATTGLLDQEHASRRSGTAALDCRDQKEMRMKNSRETGDLPGDAGRSQAGSEGETGRGHLEGQGVESCEQQSWNPKRRAAWADSEAARGDACENVDATGESKEVAAHSEVNRGTRRGENGDSGTLLGCDADRTDSGEQSAKRLRVTPCDAEACGDGTNGGPRPVPSFSSLFLSLPQQEAEDIPRPGSASQSSAASSCPPLSPANASGFFIDSAFSFSPVSQVSSFSGSQDPLGPDPCGSFQSPSAGACPVPGVPAGSPWQWLHASSATGGESTKGAVERTSLHAGGGFVEAPWNAQSAASTRNPPLVVYPERPTTEMLLPSEVRIAGDRPAPSITGVAPSRSNDTRLGGPRWLEDPTNALCHLGSRTDSASQRNPSETREAPVVQSPAAPAPSLAPSHSEVWRESGVVHSATALPLPPVEHPKASGRDPFEERLPSQDAPLESSYSAPWRQMPSSGHVGSFGDKEIRRSWPEWSGDKVFLELNGVNSTEAILKSSEHEVREAKEGEVVELAEGWRDQDDDESGGKEETVCGVRAAQPGRLAIEDIVTVEAEIKGKGALEEEADWAIAAVPHDRSEEEVPSSAAEAGGTRCVPLGGGVTALEPFELFAPQVCSRSQSSSSGSSSSVEGRRARRRRNRLLRSGQSRKTSSLDSSSCSPTVDYDASARSSDDSVSSDPCGALDMEVDSTKNGKPKEGNAEESDTSRVRGEEGQATFPTNKSGEAASKKPSAGLASGFQDRQEVCRSRASDFLHRRCVFSGSEEKTACLSTAVDMHMPMSNLSLDAKVTLGRVQTPTGTSTDVRHATGIHSTGKMEDNLREADLVSKRLSQGSACEDHSGDEDRGTSSSYAATVVLSSGSAEGRKERFGGEATESRNRQEAPPQRAKEKEEETASPPTPDRTRENTEKHVGMRSRHSSHTSKEKWEGLEHARLQNLSEHGDSSQGPVLTLLFPRGEPKSPQVVAVNPTSHALLDRHCSVSQQSLQGWPDEPAELPFFGDPRDLPVSVLRAVEATLGGRQLREQEETVLGARRAESIAAAAAEETRLLAERRAKLGRKTRRRRRKRKNARQSQVSSSSQQTASQSSQCASQEPSQRGSQSSGRFGVLVDYHCKQRPHVERRRSGAVSTDALSKQAPGREAGTTMEPEPGRSGWFGSDAGRVQPSLVLPGKAVQPDTLVVEISSSSDSGSDGVCSRSAVVLTTWDATGRGPGETSLPSAPVVAIADRTNGETFPGTAFPHGSTKPPGNAFWGFYKPPPTTHEALASCPPRVQKNHERLLRREARRETRRRQRRQSWGGEAERARTGDSSAASRCERVREPKGDSKRDFKRQNRRSRRDYSPNRKGRECRKEVRPALRWATRMDNGGRIVLMLVPASQSSGVERESARRERRSRTRRTISLSRSRAEPTVTRPSEIPPASSSASGCCTSEGFSHTGDDAAADRNWTDETRARADLPSRGLPFATACVEAESCPQDVGKPRNPRKTAGVDEVKVDHDPPTSPSANELKGKRSDSDDEGEGGERLGAPERARRNEANDLLPHQDVEVNSVQPRDRHICDGTSPVCDREHVPSSQTQQCGSLCLSAGSLTTGHSFSSACSSSDVSLGGVGEGARNVSQLSVASALKDAAKQARPFHASAANELADEAIRGERTLASYGALLAVEVLAERTQCSPEAVDAGAPDPQQDAILAVALVLRDERLSLACRRAQRANGRHGGDAERWDKEAEGPEDQGKEGLGRREGRETDMEMGAKGNRNGDSQEAESSCGDPLANSGSETQRRRKSGSKPFLSTALGRERCAEKAAASLAYFDATMIIFVDQAYKPRLPLNSRLCARSPGCRSASVPSSSTAHSLTSSSVASPFTRARQSFADFVALWQSRHPFTKSAQQQLPAFLPSDTEVVAVESERALIHYVCLIFSVADPSMVLQWDSGCMGLGFLLRRARVLGFGAELTTALGRRADPLLLSHLRSISYRPRSHVAISVSPAPVSQQSFGSVSSSSPALPQAESTSASSWSRPSITDHREARHPTPRESGRSSGVSDVLLQGGMLSGRLLLECWRLLQSEVKLQQSSLEGVATEVLGVTFASVPPAILANLWKQGQGALRRAERLDEVELMTAWREWQLRVRRHEEVQGRPRDTAEGGKGHVFHGETQGPRTEGPQTADGAGLQHIDAAQRTLGEPDSLVLEQIFADVERATGNPMGRLPGPEPRERDQEVVWAVSTMGAVLKYLLGRPQRRCALTRGSQFKVESVMIQATKRLDYLFVSPSQTQVTEQPAPLCIPLVLEPKSGFYWSPVLVLDFRSLYPSIVIANNICYSTALGSVEIDPTVQATKTLGVMDFHCPPALFRQISEAYYRAASVDLRKGAPALPDPVGGAGERKGGRDSGERRGHSQASSFCASQAWDADSGGLRLLPSGAMFVSRRVRKGIFPQVLSEILQTRIMVQKAIKKYKGKVEEGLLRLLNYRQYGLKMIANVSYGYTAASFTGHMPCADIADAIVQTARTTLMRAIELVHNTPRWGGRVLYGDTDSMFVLVENKSLEAAFEIGREIAYTVTQQNPSPVELELEKVFYPCCLVSKKRYVGNAYAAPNLPPTFEAKVKAHLYRQWTKIMLNQVPLKDFIFYKKCRLGSYKAEFGASTAASLPPQAKVAYARLQALVQSSVCLQDVLGTGTSETAPALPSGPSRGERVAFVYADLGLGGAEAFLTGKQSALRLLDCAVSPEQVEGGGRADNLVSLFLYGAPQRVLRPMPLQLPDAWTTGSVTPPQEGTARDFWSQHAGSCVWLRCWEPMPRSTVVKGTDSSLFPEGERTQAASPALQAPASRFGWRRLGMSPAGASCSGSFSVSVQQGQECSGIAPSAVQSLGEGNSEQLLLPVYLKYYIVRQVIPALDRLFGLLPGSTSVDLRQWFDRMPKPQTKPATRLRRQPQTGQQVVKKPRQGMLTFGTRPLPRKISPESRLLRARHGSVPQRTPVVDQMAVPSDAGAVSPAPQPRHKLLQALKVKNGAGGGSRVRLHHFFAASTCLFCGERCSLLPPGSLRELLGSSARANGSKGSSGGHKGDGSTDKVRRRRGGGAIHFEEDTEAAVRAQLFRKFECRNLTSDEDGEGNENGGRNNDGKLVIDLSSKSAFSSTSHGSVFWPLFQSASAREKQRYWQPPPVCAACSRDAERLLVVAYSELREEEKRVKEVEDICEACAGSRLCAAACLNAWHCDVYFRKLRNDMRLAAVSSKLRALHLHLKDSH